MVIVKKCKIPNHESLIKFNFWNPKALETKSEVSTFFYYYYTKFILYLQVQGSPGETLTGGEIQNHFFVVYRVETLVRTEFPQDL